jgi:hypothetical protein
MREFVGGALYDPVVTTDFAALHRPGQPLLLANAWDPPPPPSSRPPAPSPSLPPAAESPGPTACPTAAGWRPGDGRRAGPDRGRGPDPVSADIEDGYGPAPADVAETVRAVLDAGAVGINLEDRAGGSRELFARPSRPPASPRPGPPPATRHCG